MSDIVLVHSFEPGAGRTALVHALRAHAEADKKKVAIYTPTRSASVAAALKVAADHDVVIIDGYPMTRPDMFVRGLASVGARFVTVVVPSVDTTVRLLGWVRNVRGLDVSPDRIGYVLNRVDTASNTPALLADAVNAIQFGAVADGATDTWAGVAAKVASRPRRKK